MPAQSGGDCFKMKGASMPAWYFRGSGLCCLEHSCWCNSRRKSWGPRYQKAGCVVCVCVCWVVSPRGLWEILTSKLGLSYWNPLSNV